MGGTLSLKQVEKEIKDLETSKEMAIALQSGVSLGKDDARKDLEEKIADWRREEHTILSHKLFYDRMMKELSELADSWRLKTVPWEEVKKELEQNAGQLSEGSV